MAPGLMGVLKDKKLVIFDFDGTLANTLNDITASVNYVRKNLELSDLTPQEVVVHIGRGQGELVKGIASNAGTTTDEVLRLYREHHELHLLDEVKYYPQVAETISLLKKEQKKVVILSNKYSHYTQQIVAELKPEVTFDLILGPDNVPQKKPDPSGIYLAAEKFNIELSQTVMIGDSEYDIRAGKNAGVTTIACLYGYGDPDLLEELSDIQIESFSELQLLLT